MNTVNTLIVQELLAGLHKEADANHKERFSVLDGIEDQEERAKRHDALRKTAFMSVSADEGVLLNFMARLVNARNIVEFGCSYGISTIYLAAAAKDTGGHVVTTELEPEKVARARNNIEKAGLQDYVSFLEGDAMETLGGVKSGIDFLFLDGAKELYLPVFNLVKEKLNGGALIIADNADKEGAQLFVKMILAQQNDFTGSWLFDKRVLMAQYIK